MHVRICSIVLVVLQQRRDISAHHFEGPQYDFLTREIMKAPWKNQVTLKTLKCLRNGVRSSCGSRGWGPPPLSNGAVGKCSGKKMQRTTPAIQWEAQVMRKNALTVI